MYFEIRGPCNTFQFKILTFIENNLLLNLWVASIIQPKGILYILLIKSCFVYKNGPWKLQNRAITHSVSSFLSWIYIEEADLGQNFKN